MREGWQCKKVGELVQVLNGYAFKSSLYEDQGIRVLRITNVQKGKIVDEDPKYYPLSLTDEIRNFLLKENDLLMSLTGNVGRVGLLAKEMLPAALNQRVACLRILSDCLNLRFLFHYLNSDKFEQDAILSAKGIAQKNMSTEWLKDYKLPIPPLSVQLSIVSELDKINELIRLKKEQLGDYDKLAQSLFYEIFGDPVENEKGWEVNKLSSITSKIGSGATPKGGNESYKTEGISLIRSLNVHNNEFLYKDLAHIDNEQAETLSNVEIKECDVLLNITGASVARCCIVPKDVIPARVNQHVCIVRVIQEKALPIYINRVLTNETFQTNLLRLARSKAATREALPKSIVDNIQVPLPPLALQNLFAQRIELIEKQKAEIKSTIADLETLLASRIQYWFD